jgi:hypothetical protein
MQYRKKELYKKILELQPTLDSTEYIETLLNEVIIGIKKWSKTPDNLILNVKHFGKFHYRLAKVKSDRAKKQLYLDEKYLKNKEHKEYIELTNFILSLYEGYTQKKQEIRQKRFGKEYKTPIELKEFKILEKENKENNVNKYGYKVLV